MPSCRCLLPHSQRTAPSEWWLWHPTYKCENDRVVTSHLSFGSSESFGVIFGFESSQSVEPLYKFQWERVTEYCSSHFIRDLILDIFYSDIFAFHFSVPG